MSDLRFELVEILVRDGEADAVLPKFREHIDQRKRREALKLIDVDEEISPLLERHLGLHPVPKTPGAGQFPKGNSRSRSICFCNSASRRHCPARNTKLVGFGTFAETSRVLATSNPGRIDWAAEAGAAVSTMGRPRATRRLPVSSHQRPREAASGASIAAAGSAAGPVRPPGATSP